MERNAINANQANELVMGFRSHAELGNEQIHKMVTAPEQEDPLQTPKNPPNDS